MTAVVGASWEHWRHEARRYAERVGNRESRADLYAWLGMTYATRLALADPECVGTDLETAEDGSLWDLMRRYPFSSLTAVPVATERANAWWEAVGGEWHGWRALCGDAAALFRAHRTQASAGCGEWLGARAVLADVVRQLSAADSVGSGWERIAWRSRNEWTEFLGRWATCASCEDVHESSDMSRGNGDLYCEDCSDGMRECDSCGWWQREDLMIPRDDGTRCEECDRDRPRPWESYGFRPSPVFVDVGDGGDAWRVVTVPGDGAFLGIEWELDGGGETEPVARLVEDPDAWCWAKCDGSLSDGVEIVTHPLTYAAARQWCEAAPVTDLAAGGWIDDHTAGIHVHVSRRAFRDRSHMARFGLLVHGSGLAFGVAERCDTDPYYARRQGTRVVHRARRPDAWGGRYYAVNYNTPALATVEVRLFGSTLTRDGLLRRVEAVHAAFTYTAGIGAAAVLAGALSDDAWSAWIADHADTYPTLAAMVAAV